MRDCQGLPTIIEPDSLLSNATPERYSGIILIVPSHVSTNCGQPVIGSFVGRSPNACPPCAYKCISAGTPAFLSAM